jgi:hypothetical protein
VARVTRLGEVTFQRIAISRIEWRFQELGKLPQGQYLIAARNFTNLQSDVRATFRSRERQPYRPQLKAEGIQPAVDAALQARIRENMKALKGTAEEKALLQRYVSGLNQGEDRWASLNSEITAKELELNARESEYQQMAESMIFDQAR